MRVHDLADIEIVKEKQNAPEQEQKPGDEKKPKAKEPSYGAAEEKQDSVKDGELQEVLVQHIEAVPVIQYTGRLGKQQDASIAVTFEVDERSYLEYQRLLQKHQVKGPGSQLFVGLADENGFPHKGTLKGFDDHFNPTTGTIRAHATLPNPDRLLLEGMFVRVRMPFGPSSQAGAEPRSKQLTPKKPDENFTIKVERSKETDILQFHVTVRLKDKKDLPLRAPVLRVFDGKGKLISFCQVRPTEIGSKGEQVFYFEVAANYAEKSKFSYYQSSDFNFNRYWFYLKDFAESK
jgi:hypothetical protein